MRTYILLIILYHKSFKKLWLEDTNKQIHFLKI